MEPAADPLVQPKPALEGLRPSATQAAGSLWLGEELGAHWLHRLDHEASIQEVIAPFARRLRDQEAPVAGGPVQEAFLLRIVRAMLRADRIVGAEAREV
jgi:hypothetical protein